MDAARQSLGMVPLSSESWNMHHDKYIDDILLGDKHNEPKRFWSYLKGKRQDLQGVAPLRKTDGFLRCLSPFLETGTMDAARQSLGMVPLSSESWNMHRSIGGISSRSVALCTLMFLSNFLAPSSDMF
jgi:hypothetical protein